MTSFLQIPPQKVTLAGGGGLLAHLRRLSGAMAEQYGRFWLHERLGRGGMAEIYRATIGPDPETYAFEVALKRLPAQKAGDPALVDLLETEAGVGSQLNHPNLIRVFESGLVAGCPYIAMEHLVGLDLAEMMRRVQHQNSRFPANLAVFVASQVLRALDYLHHALTQAGVSMEIIHRDVTPANIFLTVQGDVKLGDYGVARVSFLEPQGGPRELRGKVPYLPPELLDAGEEDQTLDLWSLAATLYEMVTGMRPYEETNEDELLAGRGRRIRPAHEVDPGVDPQLSQVLSRALHRRRRKRPQDAVGFYRSLKQYLASSGIHVDAAALSRFVQSVIGAGAAPASAPVQPSSGEFDEPGYQAPVDFTMTQRIQLVQRRRSLKWLAIGVVVAVVGAVAGVVVGRLRSSGVAEPAPAAEANTETETEALTETQTEVETKTEADPPPPDEPAAEDVFDFEQLVAEEAELPIAIRNPFRAAMKKGRALTKRKLYDEAEGPYRRALKLHPKSLSAKLGLANILFLVAKHTESKRLVDGVLASRPQNARGLLIRADLMRAKAKDERAKEAYERVIQAAPDSRHATIARRILKMW